MDYTDEQLTAKFKQLPEEIQAVVADQATEEKVFEIGQKHNLHIDKIGELVDEVGLVLLGLTKPTDFVGKLKNRLVIDQTSAEAIAAEVNTAIFLEIRDALKQLHNTPPNNLPTKDELLKAIENPPAAPASPPQSGGGPVSTSQGGPAPTVFEQKMTQPFSLTDSGYQGTDPYREATK